MTTSGGVVVDVAGRRIGAGEPVFIIAEIGASHAGSARVAARLIEAAAQCGVDAVKLQVISARHSYVPGTPSYDIFDKLWLPPNAVKELAAVARANRVILFTTPGDAVDLDMLLDAGMPLVKISSGLLTNIPLITRAARTGLPMILSTGMSYLREVAASVRAAEDAGCRQLVLLHCTSIYPSPADTINLAAMQTMADEFPYPVGYSDHYDGPTAALGAVALGACAIEKHFTLDRRGGGPDDSFSADIPQLTALVAQIRELERMIGSAVKEPTTEERPKREVYRRCLVARRRIEAGEVLAEDAIACKRQQAGQPIGLEPAALTQVLGMRATRAIAENESIRLDILTT